MFLYGIEGPISEWHWLPVDQILLLGCWYLPITLRPGHFWERFFQSVFDAIVELKHLIYNSGCTQTVCHVLCFFFFALPEHFCWVVRVWGTETATIFFLFRCLCFYIADVCASTYRKRRFLVWKWWWMSLAACMWGCGDVLRVVSGEKRRLCVIRLLICIHWVLQNTKQHPFLIHAGSVYTICVICLFSFFPQNQIQLWAHICIYVMDAGTHIPPRAYR